MLEVTSNNIHKPADAAEVESLAAAGQFSVFAIRVWSSAAKQRMPVDQALGRLFDDFRCQSALQLFDECMALVAVSATRKIEIGCCPSNAYVVADEGMLLASFEALERGNTDKAEAVIGKVIISPLIKAFCRSAQMYVQNLNSAGLSFVRPVNLSVVNT
tara:strand:- start:145 stop:621 length:477 start_codon:yes stop_codon:yes gene_type:complete